MSTILLPIKPKYAEMILNGEKDIEFRKSFPKQDVDKIVIYATAPISRIVGEVEVKEQVEERYRDAIICPYLCWFYKVGISEAELKKYYEWKEYVYYYVLGKVTKYDKSLSELGINYVPQNFVYLREK